MDKKIVLFAFRGELTCFVHVLLNALDFDSRGHEARIVMEGDSVTLVEQLEQEQTKFHGLYVKAKDKGLVAGACKGCSAMLGATEAVNKAGLPLLDDVMGHPSMARWMDDGYTVITF